MFLCREHVFSLVETLRVSFYPRISEINFFINPGISFPLIQLSPQWAVPCEDSSLQLRKWSSIFSLIILFPALFLFSHSRIEVGWMLNPWVCPSCSFICCLFPTSVYIHSGFHLRDQLAVSMPLLRSPTDIWISASYVLYFPCLLLICCLLTFL